jgi:hypothetical protein
MLGGDYGEGPSAASNPFAKDQAAQEAFLVALAVVFFALVVAWAVAGISGVVFGIRKKEWSRGARLTAIVLGALAALPALYEILVLAYVSVCTRPGNTCL